MYNNKFFLKLSIIYVTIKSGLYIYKEVPIKN